MTQEEKQLLLVDLCARLPYKVKGIITYDKSNTTFTVEGIDNNVLHLSDAEECYVEDFKPHLRKTPSMTDAEKKDFPFPYYFEWIDSDFSLLCSNDLVCASVGFDEIYQIMDWLNAHHFDYRGLIEKGLAIEAPEGMYNTK